MSEEKANSKSLQFQRCPECGGFLLMRDREHAEIVCTNCGFVVASKLADRGPEWRAFNPEQRAKRARTGAPSTFTIHDKGLSTRIDWHDRDIHGRGLPAERRAQFRRLRRWHRRARVSDSNDRSITSALSAMSKAADALNLPKNILETASVIYRKAVKKRLVRGRSIQGVAAAALYTACRKCRLARTLDDVAKSFGVDKKELGRSYRFIIKELDCFVPLVKPYQYVTKLSNQLTINGKTEMAAHKVLKAARKLKLTSGRGTKGVAAAAVYIASTATGERRTQREIAEASQVTEVTIRNRYKEMVRQIWITTSL